MPQLISWSPKVTVLASDKTTQLPSSFLVNASFVFQGAVSARKGSIKLSGDWGGSSASTAVIQILAGGAAAQGGTTVHASIKASVPDIILWWPLHYGQPHLHNLTAQM